MAYLQARSDIARSGVTYAGWVPPNPYVTIAGTDRTDQIQREGFVINAGINGGPDTCGFTVDGMTPVNGQPLIVRHASPNGYLFSGTILELQVEVHEVEDVEIFWHGQAVSDIWLMDRYDLVLAKYYTKSVNAMVADFLSRFTNGGFRVGYIPESLGSLDMEFTFVKVSDCLQRIAKALDPPADWELMPGERVINMYQTYPETALPAVDNTTPIKNPKYRPYLTQARTRTMMEGQGSAASADVAPSATTVPLEDMSPFNPSGGFARSQRVVFTYTGVSALSGMGSLTGVTGLTDAIAVGEEVCVFAVEIDAAAQTALATVLGGGLSGQATHYLQDGRLSEQEAIARATSDVALFGTELKDFEFDLIGLTDAEQRWKPGRSFTASITTPLTIGGTFRIESIATIPFGELDEAAAGFMRHVTASRFVRQLSDLLKQLPG